MTPLLAARTLFASGHGGREDVDPYMVKKAVPRAFAVNLHDTEKHAVCMIFVHRSAFKGNAESFSPFSLFTFFTWGLEKRRQPS
jgi:hypothetical protein